MLPEDIKKRISKQSRDIKLPRGNKGDKGVINDRLTTVEGELSVANFIDNFFKGAAG